MKTNEYIKCNNHIKSLKISYGIMKILHLRTSDNKHEDSSPKIYGIIEILHLRTSNNKHEDNIVN